MRRVGVSASFNILASDAARQRTNYQNHPIYHISLSIVIGRTRRVRPPTGTLVWVRRSFCDVSYLACQSGLIYCIDGGVDRLCRLGAYPTAAGTGATDLDLASAPQAVTNKSARCALLDSPPMRRIA